MDFKTRYTVQDQTKCRMQGLKLALAHPPYAGQKLTEQVDILPHTPGWWAHISPTLFIWISHPSLVCKNWDWDTWLLWLMKEHIWPWSNKQKVPPLLIPCSITVQTFQPFEAIFFTNTSAGQLAPLFEVILVFSTDNSKKRILVNCNRGYSYILIFLSTMWISWLR